MTGDYDVERFDVLVREQLHAAATADLPPSVVATLLRGYATAVERHGLDPQRPPATDAPPVLVDSDDVDDRSDVGARAD